MEDLLSPVPRRAELALLPWFSWLLAAAVLLGTMEEMVASDLAFVACLATAVTAPVSAAARSKDARSFLRRLVAGSFAPGLVWAGVLCAKYGDGDVRSLLVPFLVVALAAPLFGALLHAPMLLLLRSIRARGVARHRGREALVVGAYGVAAVASLWHFTPDVFLAHDRCACEGPVLTHVASIALLLATTSAIVAAVLAAAARGVAWEARVRGRLRAALAGSLAGWRTTPAAGDGSAPPRLAIDAAPAWVRLERAATIDEPAPYRAADLHGSLAVEVPARVRSIGAAMVLNVLLGVATLLMGSAVAHEAYRARVLAHPHVAP